jgi:hypothetical protein
MISLATLTSSKVTAIPSMVMVTFFRVTKILSKVTEMNLMGISMSEGVIKMLLLEIRTDSREI